jgi:regulator of cell morphogenesis and NO signaling
MESKKYSSKKLGEIVTDDFRAAGIFKTAGIDFCCGGDKTLEQACAEKGIESLKISEELKELETIPPLPGQNFNEWDPGFLSDYIVNQHHKYVIKTLPELVFYTQKLASVHGENHPELAGIAELFTKINSELLQHMKMEEEVLFPAIKKAVSAPSSGLSELIRSEISRMKGEHEFAGGAMDKINLITSGYTVPADGCNTYQVTFRMLSQFEDDLHVHVHLENNILFPRAMKL